MQFVNCDFVDLSCTCDIYCMLVCPGRGITPLWLFLWFFPSFSFFLVVPLSVPLAHLIIDFVCNMIVQIIRVAFGLNAGLHSSWTGQVSGRRRLTDTVPPVFAQICAIDLIDVATSAILNTPWHHPANHLGSLSPPLSLWFTHRLVAGTLQWLCCFGNGDIGMSFWQGQSTYLVILVWGCVTVQIQYLKLHFKALYRVNKNLLN